MEELNGRYSELKVLRSAAGYYVGRDYQYEDADGNTWTEPGTRESGYFSKSASAEAVLQDMITEVE